jgi:hypothetical protein
VAMKGRKGRATSFAHGNLVRYFRYVRTTSIRSAAPLAFSGFCSRRIDNVMTDVILKKLRGQPVHGTSHRGDQHQYVGAGELSFQRALDGLDLPFEASDPAHKLRLVFDCMGHGLNIGGYPTLFKPDWSEERTIEKPPRAHTNGTDINTPERAAVRDARVGAIRRRMASRATAISTAR